jgi:hypothetical protein
VRRLRESLVFRPQRVPRFILKRGRVCSVIAREAAEAPVDHDPPILAARVAQRVVLADAARTGRLVCEVLRGEAATGESPQLPPRSGGSRDDRTRSQTRFRRTPERRRHGQADCVEDNRKDDRFTARLTIDVTPGLHRRIKVAAFQRGITVADMLCDLLSRQLPDDVGGAA